VDSLNSSYKTFTLKRASLTYWLISFNSSGSLVSISIDYKATSPASKAASSIFSFKVFIFSN